MIKLSTLEKNKLETIRIISESSFESLQEDCKRLNESHKQLVVFKYLQLNINDYSNFIKKTSKLPVAQLDIRTITNSSLLLETNKLILNLLSSFKFFLDNAETFLKRKYGKNSEIVNDYLILLSKHYDNSFAYRFLSKLRDYSIHIGFPLQGLSFQAEKNEEFPEKMIGEIQLLIDIELIKKEKSTFRGIHKEIMKIEDNVDIRPLIYDLSKSILNIQKYVYSVQKIEIEEVIENIETFVGDYKTKENDIKVFYNINNEEKTTKLGIYDIPFDKISDFKEYKTGASK